MKSTSLNFVHNRNGKLKLNGTAPIQLRIYLPSKQQNYFIGTNINVRPEEWNAETQEIVKLPNRASLNQELNAIRTPFDELVRKAIFEQREISLKELKSVTDVGINPTITDFYIDLMAKKKTLSFSTLKSHKTTVNHLLAFNRTISFNDLNRQTLESFKEYLFKVGLLPNSVTKNLKNLKGVWNAAKYSGMTLKPENPFYGFKFPKNEPIRDFLRPDELKFLENYKLNNKDRSLERIRDIFLFSCYTGLRYSDVSNLDHSNFFEDSGNLYLQFKSQKTGKSATVPLSKLFKTEEGKFTKPEQIYRKYEELWSIKPFSISNQAYNRSLKILSELVGISKNLTSHVARHTFGTHMIRMVPINVVKTLLQHSDIKETALYLKMDNTVLEEELDRVNKWI